jgi:hypothetical protein
VQLVPWLVKLIRLTGIVRWFGVPVIMSCTKMTGGKDQCPAVRDKVIKKYRRLTMLDYIGGGRYGARSA